MKKVQLILILSIISQVAYAQITFVETDLDGTNYNALRSIVVSPDGKFVYAGAASSDAIIVFSRNTSTGALTFGSSNTALLDKLNNVYALAISNDGKSLYSISLNDNFILTWDVNTSTGAIAESQVLQNGSDGITNMDGPVNVIISDDDKNVYVSSQNNDAIVVFDRNTTTGALTFKESLANGSGSVANLDNPRMLALSPNGDNLYVSAQTSDAVVVFDRNTSTGALTYSESHKDETGSITLLDGAHGIAVSPDGKYVFVGGRTDDGITVFTRDAADGDLTFAFEYGAVANSIAELTDPMYIVVQSDSDELYVAGGAADAALVFSINSASGELTLVEEEKDGVSGVTANALNNVHYTAISPDGKSVYFASQAGDGITTFSVDNPPASAPTSSVVAASVFLQGAYNGSSLNTTINGSIPSSQPYSGATYNNHAGTESASAPAGAVDWVLVELREAGSAATALNSTKVGSAAGFLMSDGSIKATDGTSDLTVSLSGNTGSDFFVVIYHRNHLPIMSAAAVSESSGTYTIDFTSSSANTYQTTTALASLSGSKFGLPAGDIDQDGDIDATDLNTWRTNNGIAFSYGSNGAADFNLDGVINAVDRNDFHQKNTSKTRQVPSS